MSSWIRSHGAELTWDGGASDTLWQSGANWSTDTVPLGGDTIRLDETSYVPTLLTVGTSYLDSGNPLSIYLGAGHDVTLRGTTGTEFYIDSVTVGDAYCYTLDFSVNGRQGASGTMPKTFAIWNVAEGGTLFVKNAFGTKLGASGYFTKTGLGTLRLGEATLGNLAKQTLQLRALEGTTELGWLYGNALNGITEIAEGATVRVVGYNPFSITLPFDTNAFRGGIQGLAGIFDLGGNDFHLRSLSGTSTGRLVGGNTANNPTMLTLGMGDIAQAPSELDGDFAGVISDPHDSQLGLTIDGLRSGFTQKLSGMNTFTGGTFVRGGRLVLAHASATLAAEGSLTVSGGSIDLGANQQTVAAVTLTAGEITGSSGTLTVGSLLVENTSSATLGVDILSSGGFTKRGTGTLYVESALSFAEGFVVEEGLVVCAGQTLTGSIQLSGESSLTGGIYRGDVAANHRGLLSGTVTGSLFTAYTQLHSEGLIIEGNLTSLGTQFSGSPILLQGSHLLMDGFGVTNFEGGLHYSQTAQVDWYVNGDPSYNYRDGTTVEERGYLFGAIDVGGVGLTIDAGARLLIHFDSSSESAFWQETHSFKVAGLYAGNSITGSFNLETGPESLAGQWEQSILSGDGLYLIWTPHPVAIPEPSTYGMAAAALAWVLAKRQRRKTKLNG